MRVWKDLAGVPNHQKWMNNGAFDGANLTADSKSIRDFYSKLLNLSITNEAIKSGQFYDIHFSNANNCSTGYVENNLYSFLRYTDNKKLLIIVNFNKTDKLTAKVKIPQSAWDVMKLDSSKNYQLKDILMTSNQISFKGSDTTNRNDVNSGVSIEINPSSGFIFELTLVE